MTRAHQEALRQLAATRNLREEEVLEQLVERAYERPDALLDWRPGDGRRTKGPDPFHPADEENPNPTAVPV